MRVKNRQCVVCGDDISKREGHFQTCSDVCAKEQAGIARRKRYAENADDINKRQRLRRRKRCPTRRCVVCAADISDARGGTKTCEGKCRHLRGLFRCRKYQAANRERLAEKTRNYNAMNREQILVRRRERYKALPDADREMRIASNRKWRSENQEYERNKRIQQRAALAILKELHLI